MLGILTFFLYSLKFESYFIKLMFIYQKIYLFFIKLMCSQGLFSLHFIACLVLRLASKL